MPSLRSTSQHAGQAFAERQLLPSAQPDALVVDLPTQGDPIQIAEYVLLQLGGKLGIDAATLLLLDEPGGAVLVAGKLVKGAVAAADPEARALLENPLAVQAFEAGEAVVISDLARDRRRHLVQVYRSGSLLVWPIRRQGKPVGLLLARHPLPYAFGEQELSRIATLLYLAGVALGEAQRLRQERQYRDQSLALLTLSQMLSAEISPTELDAIVHHSAPIFQAAYSLLFLAEDDRAVLPISLPSVFSHASAAPSLQRITMVATQAWRSRTAMISRSQPEVGGFHSVAFPLIHNGSSCGALVLVYNDAAPVRYAPGTWSLLTITTQMLASACASLIQRSESRLHDSQVEELLAQHNLVQRSRDLVRTAFDSIPDGMLLLDAELRVLAANQAFCQRILSCHPREVVGQRYELVWQDIVARSEVFLAPRALHLRYEGPHGLAWYMIERCETPARDDEAAGFVEIWREAEAQEIGI